MEITFHATLRRTKGDFLPRLSNVLIPVLAWGLGAQAPAATSKYRVLWRDNPATTAAIGWVREGGRAAAVHYGPHDHGSDHAAYPYSRSVDRRTSRAGMTHEFARLSGLKPGTDYYFVVRDNDGSSARMWFRTAPSGAATPFTIVAGGDSRNNRAPRRRANRMVSRLRPLCVAFGGDMTDMGTDEEWSEWWEDWQLTRSEDGRMYPLVAARGNHEGSNGIIHDMFDTPNAANYYALDIGGTLLRLYTLNTEISIAGDQTDWLKEDLAANSGRAWKLAQYHRPMRPHESRKGEGTRQYNHWAGLFHEHGMHLVVECDAHVVKTTWPIRPSAEAGSEEGFIRDDAEGTVYAGEGTWGAPFRNDDDAKAWTRSSGVFNQINWIHVSAEGMTLRKVRVDNVDHVGEVDDADPFAYPANLDVWNPANGAVIAFRAHPMPVAAGRADASPARALQGVKMAAGGISRSLGGRIRILRLPERASVRIHDMQGKLVRILGRDERLPRGVEWNGNDSEGKPAPAGLYHLKVSLGEGKGRTFPVRIKP